MIAQYIDQLIMLGAGIWATFLGFGYIRPRDEAPAWSKKFIPKLKWLGPVLIILALVLAFAESVDLSAFSK